MNTLRKQEIFTNPHTGDKLIIVQHAAATQGKQLYMEAIYQPSKKFAPEHYHPFQTERFEVLSGTLRTRINEEVRDYSAGEVFVIPAGTPHAMHNASAVQVHFSWQISPALQSEQFFRQLYQSTNTGKLSKNGKLGITEKLYFLFNYQKEFRLTSIPLFLQKVIFRCIGLMHKKNNML